MAMYTQQLIDVLTEEWPVAIQGLQELQIRCITEGEAFLDQEDVREHLMHGAGRRVDIFRHSLECIYTAFPPETEVRLPKDKILDAQICLHAFIINLSGFFDNLAWAFAHRHGLLQAIGNRYGVGLFKEATQRHLAPEIQSQLTSESMTTWHGRYLTSFRDALAHRIPLYIPPATFTEADSHQFVTLNSERVQRIEERDFERVRQIEGELANLGTPCPAFLHSYVEGEAPHPILLHPQVLSDAKVVIEFGNVFFDHWHEVAHSHQHSERLAT